MAQTIFLIGAGAIENSWQPVLEALQSVFPDVPKDDPNLPLANLVFQLRFLQNLIGTWKDEPDVVQRARTELAKKLAAYESLKNAIAEKIMLAKHDGTIRLRSDDFLAVLRRFGNEPYDIITTNWDHCVEQWIDEREKPAGGLSTKVKILHIHGEANFKLQFFLPTETAEEPYPRADKWSHRDRLGHGLQMLADVRTLVIWGLSLSPLDIELGFLMSDGLPKDTTKIRFVVVDLNPNLVAQRLRFLVPGANVEEFQPSHLTT